jgi:hypothetical protein
VFRDVEVRVRHSRALQGSCPAAARMLFTIATELSTRLPPYHGSHDCRIYPTIALKTATTAHPILTSTVLRSAMARLNEPPIPPGPSAETIETGEDPNDRIDVRHRSSYGDDAVKRRFLRQNRELAKYVATVWMRHDACLADWME